MHDKSRPAHESKKPGKTLKQKRAEKREEHVQQQHSIIPPRAPARAGDPGRPGRRDYSAH